MSLAYDPFAEQDEEVDVIESGWPDDWPASRLLLIKSDIPDEEDTLEGTWWVLDREPGMDDLAEGAGDAFKKMKDDLGIYPFQDRDGNDRVFLARFEFPKYEESFQFEEGIFAPGEIAGFIDFLAGVPIDCVEMLVAVGEHSSLPDMVVVNPGEGKVVSPVPEQFFEWPDTDKVLFNLTALPAKNYAKLLAQNLSGEDAPVKAHWWFRVNLPLVEGKKFPVPGEFLGLGVRMMPDKPWGHQLSSPFVWAGNWMDTVYYTAAVITEVIAPTDEALYPTYRVQWRKYEVVATPSDFSEYRVGDRVTILKDVSTEKLSQLWKDEDMTEFGENWQIAPITFYGLEDEQGG